MALRELQRSEGSDDGEVVASGGGVRLSHVGGFASRHRATKNDPNGLTSSAGSNNWSPSIAKPINEAISDPNREMGVNGLSMNTIMPKPQMAAVWAMLGPQRR